MTTAFEQYTIEFMQDQYNVSPDRIERIIPRDFINRVDVVFKQLDVPADIARPLKAIEEMLRDPIRGPMLRAAVPQMIRHLEQLDLACSTLGNGTQVVNIDTELIREYVRTRKMRPVSVMPSYQFDTKNVPLKFTNL